MKLNSKIIPVAFFALASCGDDNSKPADKASEIQKPVTTTSKQAAINDGEGRVKELNKQIDSLIAAFKNEDVAVHAVVDEQINTLRVNRDTVNVKINTLRGASEDNFSVQKKAVDEALVDAGRTLEALMIKQQGSAEAIKKKNELQKAWLERKPFGDANRDAQFEDIKDSLEKFDKRIYDLKRSSLSQVKERNEKLQKDLDDLKKSFDETSNRAKLEDDIRSRIQAVDAQITKLGNEIQAEADQAKKDLLNARLEASRTIREDITPMLKDLKDASAEQFEQIRTKFNESYEKLVKKLKGE